MDETGAPPQLEFVGYPRVNDGMRYGSADRLAALSQFAKDFDTPLLGIPVVLALFEGCLAFSHTNPNPFLLFGVGFGALLVYRTVTSLVSTFARCIGWKPWIGHAASIALICLAVAGSGDKSFLGVIFAPSLWVAGGPYMLIVANREVRRYGLKLRHCTLRSHQPAFEEAIRVRRQWEQHPSPPIPAYLFSGGPPKA